MASRFSTGLINGILDTGSVDTVLDAFFIDIYTGTQPADPNNAPTGVLLATLYSNGTSAPLHWEATAVNGVLSKLSTETWSTTVAATGTAGWFRVRKAGDTGAVSTTAVRADGAIATSGAEINLATTNLIAGAPLTQATFTFTLPRGV